MRQYINRNLGVAAVLLALGSPAWSAEPSARITGKDGATMVLVPSGAFVMGTGEGTAQKPEYGPPRRFLLPAFYIDLEEVTHARYAAYMGATGAPAPPNWAGPTPPKGRENHPVTDVTWIEAMKYAIWAGKRLPTEAEWEKAARGTDGRAWPWGDQDDKARRNLDGKVRPVGQYPTGASPYGCLDMAGNAWEWTADWFNAYPGSSVRSVHFGTKYKVIRGGGAEYFYAHNDNSGRCAVRARVLPYGSDDYLGFRCVKDVEGAQPAYDAAKVLAEVEARLNGSLHQPVALAYEAEYEKYLAEKRVPITVQDDANRIAHVRTGFPLPQGLVKDAAAIRLMDGNRAVPLQSSVLTPWQDGSIRWALLDFKAKAGQTLTVDLSGGAAATAPAGASARQQGDALIISTGAAVVRLSRTALLESIRRGSTDVVGPVKINFTLENGPLAPMPADSIEIEEPGPVRVVARLRGSFAEAGGQKTPFEYDLRVHALAGSARVHLLLTVTHMQARTGEDHDRTPMAKVTDFSVVLPVSGGADEAVFGTDRGVQRLPLKERAELLQADNLRYEIVADGAKSAGTRAPGWAAVKTGAGWVAGGVRHFWQSSPKAITVTPRDITLRLWAGDSPLDFEATLAKTHEIVVEVLAAEPKTASAFQFDPMRASFPPAWACGTQAIGGPLLPRGPEAIAQLPYWETLRDTSMRHWLRKMRYGFRDFGDIRHGGETKGKDAFNNLEYDVHYNFVMQFLRTGETWLLDAAEIQARHQADIDTDHVTGQPWKHSPFHTSWRADIAHQFLRGLVAHYWMTGERRSLEVARKIGDHLAPLAVAKNGFGNERQIGWGLYGLSGIYEATLDRKYIDAGAALCNILVTEQSPSGRFNIRYDNRMSLMNGMAMHGMLTVQEQTGDEKLAEGVLRLIRRTLGLYPEYAMRTLNGYAWAVKRTNDARYLDVMERTLEASMEFHMPGMPGDATTSETHAWRFPWFAAKYQLFPLFEGKPPALPEAATWRGLRVLHPTVDVYVRGQRASNVLVMLEGLATGRAELLDMAGKSVKAFDLNATDRQFQPGAFAVEAGATYLLRLASPDAKGWHLQHDAGTKLTFYHPVAPYLEDLYPRAYGLVSEGAREIVVRFEAMGEGYHGATLYDPAGNVFATSEQFVDLDDKGRYEVELKAAVGDASRTGWSLEVHDAKILSIDGFGPYWAAHPEELFNPERTGD